MCLKKLKMLHLAHRPKFCPCLVLRVQAPKSLCYWQIAALNTRSAPREPVRQIIKGPAGPYTYSYRLDRRDADFHQGLQQSGRGHKCAEQLYWHKLSPLINKPATPIATHEVSIPIFRPS